MTPQYIAGFFDGEGSICFATRKKGKVYIDLYQKPREVLDLIQEFLGYGSICMYRRGSHQLRISGRANVRRFISMIYPHSVVKKKQLEVGWAITELIGPARTWRRVSEENMNERIRLGNILSEMKR